MSGVSETLLPIGPHVEPVSLQLADGDSSSGDLLAGPRELQVPEQTVQHFLKYPRYNNKVQLWLYFNFIALTFLHFD